MTREQLLDLRTDVKKLYVRLQPDYWTFDYFQSTIWPINRSFFFIKKIAYFDTLIILKDALNIQQLELKNRVWTLGKRVI